MLELVLRGKGIAKISHFKGVFSAVGIMHTEKSGGT